MSENFREIISALNDCSNHHRFGKLQEIRRNRRPLQKIPSRYPFRHNQRDWEHHIGGRCELQFNVGEDEGTFRWGIAISLQKSRSLLDITQLFPKLQKLSAVLETHSDHFQRLGFEMWDWTGNPSNRKRSRNRAPQRVTENLYVPEAFIFIGKQVPWSNFNAEVVLRDFDHLLPVYEYVEFESIGKPPMLYAQRDFVFTPDGPSRTERAFSTVMLSGSTVTQVSLRHRRIQDELINQLKREGTEVAWEHPDAKGGYIDVVALRTGKIEFYEIKTSATVRLALREAIGQLLEYAYWPKPNNPSRVLVVAEHEPDVDDLAYLRFLSTELNLQIEYRQVKLPDR